MPTLSHGDLVDRRYRVQSLIARGGMAAIYRGIDERLDRPVALKILDDRFAHNDQFRTRFEREARAAARLSHPSLVNVFDQGDDGTSVFLAMELVDGGTLRELLRERGPMPPHAATAVMEPVLTALGLAHSAGLIHRDVKPENILISDDHQVKLADFGLVRATAESSLTTTSVMMGTVAYLSPEQVRGGSVDGRSDVYSAGIVLYELLTGTTPFHGDTSLATAYMRLDHPVPPASETIDGVPAEFDQLISRATALHPNDRFADGSEFRTAVMQVADELRLPLSSFRVPVPIDSASHRSRDAAREAKSTQTPDDGDSGARQNIPQDAPDDEGKTAVVGNVAPPTNTVSHEGHTGTDGSTAVLFPDYDPNRSTDDMASTRIDFPERQPGEPEPAHVTSSPGGTATPAPRSTASHRTSVTHGKPQVGNHSRLGCALWTVVALILVGAVSLGAWWLGSGRYGEIPSVTGSDVSTAHRNIADAGFEVTEKTEYSDTVPSKTVAASSPQAGKRVTKGTTVTLTVSAGRPTVPEIPADRSVEAYTRTLSDRTLSTKATKSDYSSDVAEGQLLSVSPAPGSTVGVHSSVTLTVSKGPKPVSIPDVSGKSEDDARHELEKAGLHVGEVSTDDSATDLRRRGKVMRTDPGEGTEVNEGSTVNLFVAPDVAVPQLIGSTVKEARAKADKVGLKIDAGDAKSNDRVLVQNPLPGFSAERDSVITVKTVKTL
ncbi:PASTA domain-containing protein [uncultured Corynebacterium sp.]|uniref:protein kinase domain-containing protein n=1 Tax=uncultured Corynebacterium sp. TaxID=159447 RepID=UPI0025D0B6BD|nr:PASTA domain-containing protein [uncultured Corynebacterium sp.]